MPSEERTPRVVMLRNLQDAYEGGNCDDWLLVFDADIQSAVTHFVTLGFDSVRVTIKPIGNRGRTE